MSNPDPFLRFKEWIFEEGYSIEGDNIFPDLPVIIATCSKNIPSSRVVYLKK